jgi:mono/diheme cytochrome c family protein
MIRRDVLYRAAMLAGLAVAAATAARGETPLERGAYLVNTIMTCNNCHTPMGAQGPQFDKALSGGLTFDEPPFKVTASNITPDKETGIGNWSAEDIKRTMRTGQRPNGIPLAPVMPTGFYGIISDADMDAIAAYLLSVKPIHNEVPGPVYRADFERTVFPGSEKPMETQGEDDKLKRGFYLATIGHCMECHTPMDKGRADFSGRLGAGGREFDGPWGKSISRNITSDPGKGLGTWTDAEIERALTQGISRDGSKLKPPMGFPYYAKMTPADLEALVAWLRSVPPKS